MLFNWATDTSWFPLCQGVFLQTLTFFPGESTKITAKTAFWVLTGQGFSKMG
jgi:hypothetical protein